jgi:hypothetical protein
LNSEYRFDIFISHASEDKDTVATPLALELQARGRTEATPTGEKDENEQSASPWQRGRNTHALDE